MTTAAGRQRAGALGWMLVGTGVIALAIVVVLLLAEYGVLPPVDGWDWTAIGTVAVAVFTALVLLANLLLVTSTAKAASAAEEQATVAARQMEIARSALLAQIQPRLAEATTVVRFDLLDNPGVKDEWVANVPPEDEFPPNFQSYVLDGAAFRVLVALRNIGNGVGILTEYSIRDDLDNPTKKLRSDLTNPDRAPPAFHFAKDEPRPLALRIPSGMAPWLRERIFRGEPFTFEVVYTDIHGGQRSRLRLLLGVEGGRWRSILPRHHSLDEDDAG